MTSQEQKTLPIAAQPRKEKEKPWWALDGPVMRISVQAFLLCCGCLLIFLAEQAHEIHVQAELKAVQLHLDAYGTAVQNAKAMSQQDKDQQAEMTRVHQSFQTQQTSVDKMKETFAKLKQTSDSLDTKVLGTFENFSGEIALLRAQTTPDGKSEESFEAQRFPGLWDQVKRVLARVDKAKPEEMAKLSKEIASLKTTLTSAKKRIDTVGLQFSAGRDQKLDALKKELKALQEPASENKAEGNKVQPLSHKSKLDSIIASQLPGPKIEAPPVKPAVNNIKVPSVPKPEIEELTPLEKSAKKIDDIRVEAPSEKPNTSKDQPQEKKSEEKKSEEETVKSTESSAAAPSEAKSLPKVFNDYIDFPLPEGGKKEAKADESKPKQKSAWDANEILKKAGTPIDVSSVPPKQKTEKPATSGSLPSESASPERCPESCMAKAHSCWLVRSDKSGKNTGKCYVGTGKLTGHPKEMTQDQCEDRGGAWCANQGSVPSTKSILAEAMARDPGPKRLADAVRSALLSKKKETKTAAHGTSAMEQAKKDTSPPPLRKRLASSHIPTNAVSLFR